MPHIRSCHKCSTEFVGTSLLCPDCAADAIESWRGQLAADRSSRSVSPFAFLMPGQQRASTLDEWVRSWAMRNLADVEAAHDRRQATIDGLVSGMRDACR
jgi:hypothetical protein